MNALGDIICEWIDDGHGQKRCGGAANCSQCLIAIKQQLITTVIQLMVSSKIVLSMHIHFATLDSSLCVDLCSTSSNLHHSRGQNKNLGMSGHTEAHMQFCTDICKFCTAIVHIFKSRVHIKIQSSMRP